MPGCPAEVRDQVDGLLLRWRSLLGDSMVGVYLHGSLALGCFNPARSDIDLLAVTEEAVTLPVKRLIVEHLIAVSGKPRPVEVSFLARAHLHPWRYPTPYDLHYSEAWRERYAADLSSGAWESWGLEERTDPDLAAHVTVLNARGILLAGRPIPEVFPSVPRADCLDSVTRDLREGMESSPADPVSFVLNCCRTLAFLGEGRVLSKEEGGAWARAALPPACRGIVEAALRAYRGEAASMPADDAGLEALRAAVRAGRKEAFHGNC